MINYIVDGSFEGLLTAVYEAYYTKNRPENIISEKDFLDNFLYKNLFIKTDSEKYRRVYIAIKSKISERALENIYHAFLSEDPKALSYIYNYIRFGFKIGSSIDLHLTDPIVMNVHKLASKVTSENHLLMGLLRFKKIKGDIYYASIEPDNNIISLLAEHFKNRLRDQNWVIHDLKRGTAAIFNKQQWVIENIYTKNNEPVNYSSIKEIDMDFENLWKLYFKHISIEIRKNPKLQKQHMPQRYWYHLTEKKL